MPMQLFQKSERGRKSEVSLIVKVAEFAENALLTSRDGVEQ
jgi:hypothetical protein